LLNPLSNSVKFTERSGRIAVSAMLANGLAEIEVADNGIGIAPEDLEKVLSPFGQVDSALARDHQGTGLGLPLAEARAGLIKPAHVKFVLTPSHKGTYSLGFDRETFDTNDAALAVILSLMKEDAVLTNDTPELLDHLDLLRTLYNHQALEFVDGVT